MFVFFCIWLHLIAKCRTTLITGRIPRSGKLSVLNLLNCWKTAFSHCRGNSLHRFMWNFAWATGTLVRLVMRNFTSIGTRVWVRGPKSWKFPLFRKEWSHRGELLGRFLQVQGAFMRPTTLNKSSKFDMIRFTGYGVIAEKPRVGHLPRIFPCTL